tara:strand:- start:521 stop:916 length:396 start_codon:yes stop_codon:yes gene_type:complete
MSSGFEIKLETNGKIFKNPRLLDAINKGIQNMALVTEERVKKQLYKGHGVLTGHLRRSISGMRTGDLRAQVDSGKILQGANVVYTDWVEGISSRNAISSFKGYKMFENAKKELEKENKDKYFKQAIEDTLV